MNQKERNQEAKKDKQKRIEKEREKRIAKVNKQKLYLWSPKTRTGGNHALQQIQNPVGRRKAHSACLTKVHQILPGKSHGLFFYYSSNFLFPFIIELSSPCFMRICTWGRTESDTTEVTQQQPWLQNLNFNSLQILDKPIFARETQAVYLFKVNILMAHTGVQRKALMTPRLVSKQV